jgi:lipopolysaccharide transport system permease protein
MTPPNASEPLIIEAGRAERHYWRDLWRYRELLTFLAWRDVRVRYKQAVLGVAWVLFQPIVTTVIFTFVFGRLAGMPSGGVPYPLLVLAGLLPWQLFANGLTGSSGSLISNANLVSKIYFPRLLIPLSALAVALIDFAIIAGLFAGAMVWIGIVPSWRLALLPVFVLLTLAAALGAGLWLTALTVRYRDFRFITPFLLQVGVFLTPVGFRTDNLPNWRDLLTLNPLTALVDGFRWCLLPGSQAPLPHGIAYSIVFVATLLWSGVRYFRRTERTLADQI